MAVVFNFDKSYEEIQINDKMYTIDFSDDAVMGYLKKFTEFEKKHQALQQKDIKEDTDFAEAKALVAEVVDTILGPNKFDALYLESGKSLYNMLDLVAKLSEMIGAKVEKIRNKNRAKYVKQ